MSSPAFVPSAAQIEGSRVQKFMSEHDIANISDLREAAVNDPGWFWDAIVKYLDLPFAGPYSRVMDDSQGMAWTKWFVGGSLNIVDACLNKQVALRPNNRAVIWEGDDGEVREWTYTELNQYVTSFAATLKSNDIGEGDVVGIYMPMVPEIVAAVLAVAKLGAIFLPLFSGYGAEAVETRLIDSGAKALITVDGFLRRGKRVDTLSIAGEAVENVSSFSQLFVVRRMGDVELAADACELSLSNADQIPTVHVSSEHPLFLAYTSGTTGKPKGVVHVHGGFLVKIAEEVAFQTDVGPDDTLFWFTDMGWIMGPWEVVGGLANGACIALFEGAPDYPSVDRLWKFCADHRVLVLGASPTLIRALMPHGEEQVRKHDLSALRILGSTGEPWNEDPWWWYFRVVGGERCPVINLSGGTEVGACFLSPHPVESISPMSLGGPALGMAVDVYDDNAQPIRNAVGELVCTKPWPSMTRGLWKAPERFLETYFSRFPDVWVHGDWASIDSDGEWFLHGRSDDTIKVAGKRIGPAEVESAAVSHPAVVEAVAIGVPDDAKGEVLWVFVVAGESTELDNHLREEIKHAVAERVGKSFMPADIKFVKALPKTRNGKILRRAVRAVALGKDVGDMSSIEDVNTLDQIRKAQ